MSPPERVRPVDREALAGAGPDERVTLMLAEPSNGANRCEVRLIRTPAGGGSPAGLHVHDFEQVFYVLEGTMTIEMDGAISEVEAPSAVVFPQGVPHRNWNSGRAPTLHLAINAPPPDPDRPLSRPV